MSFREQAIELLKLISSFDEQIKYEKAVPIADVPAELICMWFDDFYHLTEDFKKVFTTDELDALSKFNSFYDDKVTYLLELKSELKEFHKSSVWKQISEEAKKALNILKTV